jgi:hypothetical protein
LDNAWYFNTGDGWIAQIGNGNVYEQIEGLKHVKLLCFDATIIGHEDDLFYRPIISGPDWEPLNIEMPVSWEKVQVDSVYVRLNESENAPLELLKKQLPEAVFKTGHDFPFISSLLSLQGRLRKEQSQKHKK